MSATYKTMTLSESMGYTSIIDPKFKTNTIHLRFILPIVPEKSSAFALAAGMLTTSCKSCPTIADLNRRMNRLYGAYAASDIGKLGDYQIVSFTFSALCNTYALDDENILEEIMSVMKDCLFEPNVENGGFESSVYNIKLKDLLDTIEAEINEKRGYAIDRCGETLYKNEPVSYSCYGTKEQVLALTPQIVYNAYKELLSTASVELYYVGAEPDTNVAETLKKAFSAIDRSNAKAVPCMINYSPLKAETAHVREKMAVEQCKLVMGFKTSCHNPTALLLLSSIYGGTAFSKLFTNVREKLSLCYYCSSSYSELKGTLTVDSGVEKSNVDKAIAEICRQLESVAEGDFTDELLENTKRTVYNSLKTYGSSPASYINWHFSELIRGKKRSLEEAIESYRSITREDIIEAAKSFTLDTVYVLEAEEEQEEE